MVTKAKRPKGQRPELLKAAEALKVCRQRMDVTQEELADLLGVEWNTVRRWETAQREIPEMATRLLKFVEAEHRENAARQRTARPQKGR
jgi:DNA-binding transcriptional regulator YiaG